MKINFLTTQPRAACSQFYIDALRRLPNVTFFDQDIGKYNVVLVMTYDHQAVAQIKNYYPSVKVGLIDPRSYLVHDSAAVADFLIVDSIEMEDYWRQVGKPIFRYVEYPNISPVKKDHRHSETIKIGYHGNQIHLACMSESTTTALTILGKKYDIELVVMYNGQPPNGNEPWYPNVKVTHVPWSMEAYRNVLGKCDIGIVPNNMLHDSHPRSEKFNYSPDDYAIRFKMPSNPGRFVIFGLLGIPVVADFYPSALQYLNGDTGFVACNVGGWVYCLERLIKSCELRQTMGDNLQQLVLSEFDFDKQNQNLIHFLLEQVDHA